MDWILIPIVQFLIIVYLLPPTECTPACGELEVCTTGGTCECGDKSVRDGRGNCVPATPVECTPACGELEVCTTGGTCVCDSSSIRDTNGTCVRAAPIECTPACGEGEVCTTEGKCECGSSLARDGSGNCVPAISMRYNHNFYFYIASGLQAHVSKLNPLHPTLI